MADLRIFYPRDHRHVPSRSFVIYGDSKPAVGPLQAVLKKNNSVIAQGTSLRPPPHWAIFFKDIALGGPYSLEVSKLGPGNPALANLQEVFVDEAQGIQILHPLPSDSPVCPSFVAQGTSDGGKNVAGTMHSANLGQTFNGNPLQQPTGGSSFWSMQFTDVGTADDFDLHVDDEAAGGAFHDDQAPIGVGPCILGN
jgi:hypothetical protein